MNDPSDHTNPPVALVGRIPTKFSSENGVVQVGDRLTVSKTLPGYAMKQTESGESIGIALESSGPTWQATSTILTFVNLGYQDMSTTTVDSLVDSIASSTPIAGSLGERFLTSLFARLREWLANSANGIGDLFARIIHSDTIYTKTICVGNPGSETCLTQTQINTVLANINSSQSNSGNGNGGTATSTPPENPPPVITVVGNNPATITVGTSYADLGATVTDTNSDGTTNNNLGLHYSVDGTDVTDITIDTATTSTHTIIYSAQDTEGAWGYATRTVEVIPQ